jgi:integrase
MSTTLTMADRRGAGRKRGNIGERRGTLRVRLFAGMDPVTSKQVYLPEPIEGTDRAAWRKAEDRLSQLHARVLKQRTAASSVSPSYAIDEWFRTAELETSTRDGYPGVTSRAWYRGARPRDLESIAAQVLRPRRRTWGGG